MATNVPSFSTITVSLINKTLSDSGFTQAELARRAGLPRSVLNAYLRGSRHPSADALARIAAAAGFQLELTPHSTPVDPKRAARLLTQVIELAEALPFHRVDRLEYPRLPRSYEKTQNL